MSGYIGAKLHCILEGRTISLIESGEVVIKNETAFTVILPSKLSDFEFPGFGGSLPVEETRVITVGISADGV
jgi:hypothetical protein